MEPYHKIDSVFKRDPANNMKTFLLGQYARPEFEYLAANHWEFTEKVDGTNIRVMIHAADHRIEYGGKTGDAQIPAKLVDRLRERFEPQRDFLRGMFPDGGCLYGEGYGARIQKGGGNYRADQDFILFDVRVGKWWLQRPDVVEIASKLALSFVPVIGIGNLADMVEMVRPGYPSVVARAHRGGEAAYRPVTAEGIVARPLVELQTRSGHRIITKLKYKDFEHAGTTQLQVPQGGAGV